MTLRGGKRAGLATRIGIAVGLVVTLVLLAETTRAQSSAALDQKAALALSQGVVGTAPADYEFTEAQGKRVRLSQYRGKPLVVSFVYTGCYEVCPATTQFLVKALRSAQQTLGADSFHSITIGFNLPHDNPVAMKDFARRHGADLPGWSFLSPDAGRVDALLRDFGFSYAQTAKGFDHVLQLTVVDPEGRIYRQLYGDSFDLPLLVGPLKELVTGQRSASPALADWLERVRLLCTVYDPSAGRYRLNYAVVIELLVGASIVLAGTGSLIYEWRRQRRRSRG
ncbi:MAG: SCO family protein [Burkholderiales bacterium]|nr:SCO family protein [Burkholderiales bacterium]